MPGVRSRFDVVLGVFLVVIAGRCAWCQTPQPGGQETPRADDETVIAGIDSLPAVAADAKSLLDAAATPLPPEKRAPHWHEVYRMVVRIDRVSYGLRQMTAEQDVLRRQIQQHHYKLREYLRGHAADVDALSRAVMEAESVRASVRRGAVRKRPERVAAARKALDDLQEAIRKRRAEGRPFPAMMIEAHRMTFELRFGLPLRETLEEEDLRAHIDLAYEVDGAGAFESLRSFGLYLYNHGRREAGPFFMVLAQEVRKDAEKEYALYWRAETLHFQQGAYDISVGMRLQAAVVYLNAYQTGPHWARVKYIEADACTSLGRHDAAIAALRASLEVDKTFEEKVRFRIVSSLCFKRDYRPALDELGKIKRTETNAWEWDNAKKRIDRGLKRLGMKE